MWIKKVQIINFGQFKKVDFDFKNDLQVVFGLNEAGKTTLHQFIGGVLFGFPTARGNNKKTFENLVDGIYGGSLIISVNNCDYLVTRLGRTESKLKVIDLINNQEYSDPEEKLQFLIEPLTLELFNSIYSFDQEALLKIFNLRPDSFNDYLRSVSIPGSEEWMQIANDLDKVSSSQMGRTKTAKRPLNQELDDLNKLEQQYQHIIDISPNLIELEQDLKRCKHRLIALKNQQNIQQNKMINQSNLAAYRPAFQQLQSLNNELKERKPVMSIELSKQIQDLYLEMNKGDKEEVELIMQDKLDRAEYDLDQLEKANFTIQQIKEELSDNEKQLQMLWSKWNVSILPKPLNFEQLSTFHQMRIKPKVSVSFFKGLMLFGEILIILGILSLSVKQIGISMGLIISGLVVIVWRYISLQNSNELEIDLTTIDPEYKNWALEMIELVQDDAKRQMELQSKILLDKEKIQKLLQRINLLDQKLMWLGLDLGIKQRRVKLENIKLEKQNVQEEKVKLLKQQAKMQTLLSQLNLKNYSEFKKRQIYDEETKELLKKKKLLDEQLKDVNLNSMENLPSDDRQIKDQQKVLQEINEQQAEISKLEYKREQIKKDDSIEYLRQKLYDTRAQVLDSLQKYFVEKLLSQWIKIILNQTIYERLPQLMQSASEYLKILTNGRYIKLKYTKTLLRVQNIKGEIFNLIDLSKGTAEQIYVALRLAFVKQMENTAKLPLLIDDAFIDFDENRRMNLMKILEQLSSSGYQIIYFTAHKIDQKNIIELSNPK